MTDDVKEANVQAAKHLRPVPNPVEEVEILFRQHHDQIYRTAYRVTGSSADAEDVLQTVFLRLVKRDARDAGGGVPIDLSPSPGSYLHRAAVNASLDLIRSRTRSNLVPRRVARARRQSQGNRNTNVHREMQVAFERRSGCWNKCGRGVVASISSASQRGSPSAGTSQMVVGVMLHRARTRLRKELGKILEGSHETV